MKSLDEIRRIRKEMKRELKLLGIENPVNREVVEDKDDQQAIIQQIQNEIVSDMIESEKDNDDNYSFNNILSSISSNQTNTKTKKDTIQPIPLTSLDDLDCDKEKSHELKKQGKTKSTIDEFVVNKSIEDLRHIRDMPIVLYSIDLNPLTVLKTNQLTVDQGEPGNDHLKTINEVEDERSGTKSPTKSLNKFHNKSENTDNEHNIYDAIESESESMAIDNISTKYDNVKKSNNLVPKQDNKKKRRVTILEQKDEGNKENKKLETSPVRLKKSKTITAGKKALKKGLDMINRKRMTDVHMIKKHLETNTSKESKNSVKRKTVEINKNKRESLRPELSDILFKKLSSKLNHFKFTDNEKKDKVRMSQILDLEPSQPKVRNSLQIFRNTVNNMKKRASMNVPFKQALSNAVAKEKKKNVLGNKKSLFSQKESVRNRSSQSIKNPSHNGSIKSISQRKNKIKNKRATLKKKKPSNSDAEFEENEELIKSMSINVIPPKENKDNTEGGENPIIKKLQKQLSNRRPSKLSSIAVGLENGNKDKAPLSPLSKNDSIFQFEPTNSGTQMGIQKKLNKQMKSSELVNSGSKGSLVDKRYSCHPNMLKQLVKVKGLAKKQITKKESLKQKSNIDSDVFDNIRTERTKIAQNETSPRTEYKQVAPVEDQLVTEENEITNNNKDDGEEQFITEETDNNKDCEDELEVQTEETITDKTEFISIHMQSTILFDEIDLQIDAPTLKEDNNSPLDDIHMAQTQYFNSVEDLDNTVLDSPIDLDTTELYISQVVEQPKQEEDEDWPIILRFANSEEYNTAYELALNSINNNNIYKLIELTKNVDHKLSSIIKKRLKRKLDTLKQLSTNKDEIMKYISYFN